MEQARLDHTRELEIRVKAIQITSEDTCVFFQRRDDCIMGFKRCRYCRFAQFGQEESNGFCKFKK